MDINVAVEEYGHAIHRLSKKTQSWYLQKLHVFADWCSAEGISVESLRVADVRRFISYVTTLPHQRKGTKLSTYTIHGYAQVCKGFLNWCGKEDGIEDILRPQVGRKVEMPRVDEKVIETFTPLQIRALLKACEREFTDRLRVRDVAIVSVLLDTGIRASELLGLRLDHVHLEKGDAYIKVFGKGRKEREVGLGDKSRLALFKYIQRFRQTSDLPFVFLGRYGEQFTLSGLDRLISRLGEWANVSGVRCSPHTFRHTFAVTYLMQGGDVYKLSRLMGHTSVSITEVYARSMSQREARNGPSVLDEL